MVLRKANRRIFINYQWRILLPTLGLLWIVVGALAFFQVHREQELRTRDMERMLDNLSASVIDAYENGQHLNPLMDFLNLYYNRSRYRGLHMTVYSDSGRMLANIGTPISFDLCDARMEDVENVADSVLCIHDGTLNDADTELFYFSTDRSTDGRIVVLTGMVQTAYVDSNLSKANVVWWFVIPLMLVASVLFYIFIHHIAQNVSLLNRFAYSIANGQHFEVTNEFPHDEFGQISRQLVKLYDEKDEAKRQSEHEHAVALNAIQEKARMKREMSNNISHELKTPVGIIKGYIDTILSTPDMDAATMRHFIERSQHNVDRLVDLLNDLSIVTRLEDGTRQISVTNVDFHDLVYTVSDDINHSPSMQTFRFTYSVPLNIVVRGNEEMLTRMLTNLIRNAAFHSGGTMCRLEYVDANDRYYIFRFYDDGQGVPNEALSKLFDRFYRVDKGRSRKQGSSGLGLSIVQNVVNSLGGAISVKNRSQGGLEYIFTLEKWTSTPRPDAGK